MLIGTDSFDLYSTLTQRWDTVSTGLNGTPKIETAAARNGSQGMLINEYVAAYTPFVRKNFTSRATYIVGFAFQALTGWADTGGVVSLWDGGTNQVELRMNSTGNFQFYRNGTALGSQTAYALTFNTWHSIEIFVTINSTSGVCQLHVDCLSQISLSGQNTQSSSNATASGVALGAGTASGVNIYAVAVDLRAEKDDSGTRSIRALASSGSTTVDNGTDFPLSENLYTDYQAVFEVDPNTSAPWTISGVNAAQFGIKTSV